MKSLDLYVKLSFLPGSLKARIMDYIDYVISHRLKPGSFREHPKAGCMKGTFKMGPDFDEPLDDLKDYME